MEQRRKRYRIALLVGGCLLLAALAGPAQAVVVDRLYEAVVPVDDTGEDARDEAFREALRQVLLRLTGNRESVRELVPPVSDDDDEGADDSELSGRAARFIDAFSYRRDDDDQLELHATLSASALGRELADREIPVWGANRPRLLVWFVVDDRGERELIHRENTLPPFLADPMEPLDGPAIAAEKGPWKEPLSAASRRRGLPVALPFNDEQDRSRVSISEIWGLFPERIRNASERYEHDRLAVVRVNRLGGGWRARWHLWRDGSVVADGTMREDDRASVVDSLVDAWADRLASNFAVALEKGDGLRSARMVVSGVDSLKSYAAVRQSLSSLEPFRSVQVSAVNQNRLTLGLAFNGDLPLLRDYIALDERLELMGGPPDGAIPTGSDDGDGGLSLYYRWAGGDSAGRLRDDDEPVEIVPLESPEDESGGDVAPLL
ncbi:MAG: DUF2066 domain-containing protein [Pseudomonadota bacterium]